MTRLWPIFFSLCSLFANPRPSAAPVRGAAVTGKIELASGQPSSEAGEQGLSDIVVWLEPVGAKLGESLRPEHVQLVQKDKMFHPHTLAVDVGSTVDFPNKDPIFHNAFSNFDGQLFDLSLYPAWNQPIGAFA